MVKSQIINILKFITILLSFWFVGSKIFLHLDWLLESGVSFKLIIIICISITVYSLGRFFLSLAWRNLLLICGHKYISRNVCNSIYGKTQIAKYMPGNVFHFVGRHILGVKEGINNMVLVGATIYEILGLLTSSLIIGLSGVVIFDLGNIYFSFNQMIIILTSIIVATCALTAIAPYLMRLRDIILPKYGIIKSLYNIIKTYLFYFSFFIIVGLLFALIVNYFFHIDFIIATKLITIFSISWLLGFIIPGAPGGIGVREAALIFFTAPIIGEAESVLVAIILRLVTLFGDLMFFVLSSKKYNL